MNKVEILQIDELEKMRQERGINKSTISQSVGGRTTCWEQAVRKKHASDRLLRNMKRAFDFYDENGYIPMYEIEMEPIGIGNKT